ncbi:MAG: hypothetical protein RL272_781 [Candidatus Parcubacteria bacterium]
MGLLDFAHALLFAGAVLASVFLIVKAIDFTTAGKNVLGGSPAAAAAAEPPPVFAQLRALGFAVVDEKEYSAFPAVRVGGYAVRCAPESVYPCRACGQRGKHALGEMAWSDAGRSGTTWLGHVCGRCGHFERYRSASDGGGFLGLMLDDAACVLDVIALLESYGPQPLLAKMERALVEREAVLYAKAQAVAMARCAVSESLGGAAVMPFRSLQGNTKFLA